MPPLARLVAAAVAALTCSQLSPPPPEHRFCGWLYGSRNPVTLNTAYDTFAAHAGELDAVHPTWFHVTSLTDITARSIGFEDRRVMANTTSSGKHARLIPTVQAEDLPDRVFAHRIINDPALRRRHVEALVELTVSRGYDGLDLDYEHLGQTLEPGQTTRTERAAFSAFVTEAAEAMHAAGKELTLAVPVQGGSPDEIYDYDALSAAADHVHIMGYDYHYEGGPHPGPVAPLGWIREVVAHAASIDGGSRKERFVLSVPNYGLRGSVVCNPTLDCLAQAGEGYRTTTPHMKHEGVDPGRSPNQTLADGVELYFDDITSLEEKVEAAAQGGLGGVGYWAIGGEPDRPGDRTFFEMVRSHFPQRGATRAAGPDPRPSAP